MDEPTKPTDAPQPVDYAPASPPPDAPKSWYPISAVMSVYPAGGIILIILISITPNIRRAMEGNKQEIPSATQFMLHLSDWTIHGLLYAWIVFIAAIPALIAYLRGGKPMTPRSKKWTKQITLLITIAFIFAAVITLYLPMLDLAMGLGNGK